MGTSHTFACPQPMQCCMPSSASAQGLLVCSTQRWLHGNLSKFSELDCQEAESCHTKMIDQKASSPGPVVGKEASPHLELAIEEAHGGDPGRDDCQEGGSNDGHGALDAAQAQQQRLGHPAGPCISMRQLKKGNANNQQNVKMPQSWACLAGNCRSNAVRANTTAKPVLPSQLLCRSYLVQEGSGRTLQNG